MGREQLCKLSWNTKYKLEKTMNIFSTEECNASKDKSQAMFQLTPVSFSLFIQVDYEVSDDFATFKTDGAPLKSTGTSV